MNSTPQTQLTPLTSAADWAALFRSAPVAMSLASLADGRLLTVNDCYAQLAGTTREALIGRPAADLHVVESAVTREQIATLLDERSTVTNVASRFRTKDGTVRETLSSLQVVDYGGEPAMLSITLENDERLQRETALHAEAKALKDQLNRMEREMARHQEREERLINQVSGLCDQAGLLKSDVFRLKSLQQELNAEIEGLRVRSARLKGETPPAAPAAESREAAEAVAPAAAPAAAAIVAASPTRPDDTLVKQLSSRLGEFEQRLQAHVAALRSQAALLEEAGR